MAKATIILRGQASRSKAARWCRDIKFGTAVTFQEVKRSIPQNARLHALLTHFISFEWHGQFYSMSDWKSVFICALRRSRFMPAVDGSGLVPIGDSTSKLSKEEFSELMDLITAFAAEHNIDIREDDDD